MAKVIHGSCGHCEGVVSTPEVWMGVNAPIPTCEQCGAQVQVRLPKLDMGPVPKKFKAVKEEA